MNILVRMPNWIGDAVMATPALRNLQKEYKDANFYIVTSLINYDIFAHDPSIKKVFVDNSKKSFFRYKGISLLAQQISGVVGVIDIAVTFQNNYPSALLLLLIKAKKRYGATNGLRNLFLSKAARVNKYLHQAEIYNDIVNKCLEKDNKTERTSINVKTPPVKKSRKRVGINPGATYGSAKRWDPHKFAEVALVLSSEYDVFILGSNAESDIANKIENVLAFNDVRGYENLAGRTSIYELVQTIATLDLFITNDSGPMHIAGAFQIPTVAIFGSTNHIQTCQWKNEKSATVRTAIECSPCMKRVCPKKHHKCMKEISVADVLGEIKEVY